jgi:hypothetical protein
MFDHYQNCNRPRWQVFTSLEWLQGHLYGEYERLSDADEAMQQLRERGLMPWLHETWCAHYSHVTNH